MDKQQRARLIDEFFELQNQIGYGEISKEKMETELRALIERYKPDADTFAYLIEEYSIPEMESILNDLM